MGVCPNGHESPNNTKSFCATCGAALIPTCANGHPLRSNTKFCATCGVSTVQAETPGRDATIPASTEQTSNKTPLIAIASIAIVVVVVIIVLSTLKSASPGSSSTSGTFSSPSLTTTTTAAVSPQSQAAALTSLLQSAPQDRSRLQVAIDAIEGSVNSHAGCQANVATAVSEIQQVASNRQILLQQLSSTSLSSLPRGESLTYDLRSSWMISERIDQDFSQWALTEQENNCNLSDSDIPSYQATDVLDPKSTAIKTVFVNLWNPIARNMGQPSSWTAAQI